MQLELQNPSPLPFMNKNRNILRGIVLLSYVVVIVLILYGIASIFTYLNTGADRSKMLHVEIKQIDQYLPELSWAPLNNEGRLMDEQTLQRIENDYLDGLYVKHTSLKTNTTNGIEDYYTESARENLYALIDQNASQNIHIEQTTLSHEPRVDFFSEDGQLVVLTDENVIEYKRLFKDNALVTVVRERSSYRATLLLEDGFWRIRHLVKMFSEPYSIPIKNSIQTNYDIKGINYYPQDTPWDMYGEDFDKDIIDRDFKLISKAGLNTIRVFVPYEDFGKSNVRMDKLEKLETTLDVAEKHGLNVLVTLFDFYGDYSVLDWTLNQTHAKTVVNALKSHKGLLGWDIKNEPNLDFDSRGKPLVMDWLTYIMNVVKSQDSIHPVTVGWSNVESAELLADEVDFVSYHFYENIESFSKSFKALKQKVNDKPVVITEFGVSSYNGFWNPFGDNKEDQAEYHKTMQSHFKALEVPFMSWTLYDFTDVPTGVVGRLPWRKNPQKQFGFIDKNGEKKPSFEYISSE